MGSTCVEIHINSFLTREITDSSVASRAHGYIITTGHAQNMFIASKLIACYASVEQPHSATKVFDHLCFKDPFLWNSIIKAHFSNGNYFHALGFFSKMQLSGTMANQFTIPMVISACAELELLCVGASVHGMVSKANLLYQNSAVGSSFVYMYSRCGSVSDAFLLFHEIPVKDVVTWTALVIGCVQNGESEKGLECLCEMYAVGGYGERPNFRTLEGGFQACGDLNALLEGRCLHGSALKSGIVSSTIIQSTILSMYSKCGSIEDAHVAFCEVASKDLFSWTSMIGVHARVGSIQESIRIFIRMQASGVIPDGKLISSLLCGFSNAMMVSEGKAFHGFVLRKNYELDSTVDNALVSMYCKFGLMALAQKIFNKGHEQENDSWNLMIVGYEKAGLEMSCIELFIEMRHRGIGSDLNSLMSVICSCSKLKSIHLGQSIHCHIIRNLMFENIAVVNSLISMYGKCGKLTMAFTLFNLSQKDIGSWNSMISSYIQNENFSEALILFDKMISGGLKPNTATIVTLLSACGRIAAAEKGKEIHNYINEQGFECNTTIDTALLDMYSKCGLIKMAREIFDSMHERDVISWNVMISCYGIHGMGKSAIEIFDQMKHSDVRPNELTFLAVLSACAHSGLAYEGKALFQTMKEHSLVPTLKHYACMVDLLGRSGNLEEAEAFISSMPIAPDGVIWGTLLTACKLHNNTDLGIKIAKQATKTDPENDGYYVLLSDLYSSLGMWKEVERARLMIKDKGLRKSLGWSTL
ncbi:pentatricopeptide repeat-containing protein mitochondrial [Dorcoceras hygrometricum]|uniref:Pentatricopeptide repeat-containing protein mitochondrial n=1 Tax=Dorcoceras hygrometricum TaxID=472368 RepID=A0A2Z7CF75_9LAMI|nr:pentatricopeptide repeat-containing protein mitochondrial [Dorcoceras hygrometricum]